MKNKNESLVRELNEPLNSRKTNAFKGLEEEGYNLIGFKELAGIAFIVIILFLIQLFAG